MMKYSNELLSNSSPFVTPLKFSLIFSLSEVKMSKNDRHRTRRLRSMLPSFGNNTSSFPHFPRFSRVLARQSSQNVWTVIVRYSVSLQFSKLSLRKPNSLTLIFFSKVS